MGGLMAAVERWVWCRWAPAAQRATRGVVGAPRVEAGPVVEARVRPGF